MQYKVALYLDFSAGSRVSCIVSIVRDLIRKKNCPDRHLSLVHYCVSLASVLPPKRNKPNAIFVLIVLGNLRKAILTFHLSHISKQQRSDCKPDKIKTQKHATKIVQCKDILLQLSAALMDGENTRLPEQVPKSSELAHTIQS